MIERLRVLPCWEETRKNHWYEFLASQIARQLSIEAKAINMSSAKSPKLMPCITRVIKEVGGIQPISQVGFVGHSYTAALLCKWLTMLPRDNPVGAIILVAPSSNFGLKELDQFSFDPEQLVLYRNRALRKLVIVGEQDPYVSITEAKRIANALDAQFVVIPDHGHFGRDNQDKVDTRQLPELMLRKIMNPLQMEVFN